LTNRRVIEKNEDGERAKYMYLSQGKMTSECFDLPLFCVKKQTNKQTKNKRIKRPLKDMESPSAAVSIIHLVN